MVIVVPRHREGAKEALHLEGFPAFAVFSRFGLVSGVATAGGLLQEDAHQRAGRP